MTVLTSEEINQCISVIALETKCSPRNMPPIKRSNSAPPISWTSLDEDYEVPENGVQSIPYYYEDYEAPYSIYSSVEYSEFYFKCSEAQRKKLHLPKCPQRITRRKKLPPTPKYSLLSPTQFKYTSPKKSNNLNNNSTSFKKQSSQETVKRLSTVKSDNSPQKKQVKDWFEARKMVAPSNNANPQFSENEQKYKQAKGIPPTQGIAYKNEKPYPNDFRYNEYEEYPYDGYSYDGYSYDGYSYDGYSYDGYPSNEFSYDEYPSNGYSYDGYSYNGYPYKNEYPHETYSQNGPPPSTTIQAPPPTHGTKQNMMDDFKANDPQSLQSAIDTGYLGDIITCSDGSRLIQRLIEVASAEEKAAAFNVLCPDIVEIAKDQFGNYVIQKFFEFGNEEHKPYIIQKLFGNVMHLSLHSFGCRVVQKAIEHSSNSPDILAMLLREIQECGGISKCMYDPNGNHVIQRFIEKAPSYIIDSIMKASKGNVTTLAQNKFGCRIVQKLLQHSTDKQKHILVKQIIERTIPLSYNAYGNYVIQFLLENDSKTQKEIFARVYKDLLKLSLNKYGSNVVEKCMVNGDVIDRELFFNYVLPKKSHKNSRLVEMMKNEYGNYVIQKMIELANEDQLYRFASYTRTLDVKLCSFPFGKYIQSRMDKVMKSHTELPN